MILVSDKKFCFYHVPKTGGSSVLAALLPLLGTTWEKETRRRAWQLNLHQPARAGDSNIGMHATIRECPPPKGHGTACFVRSPFTIMVSLYGYARLGGESFTAFCQRFKDKPHTLKRQGKHYMMHYAQRRQGDYAGVDWVGRFEHLERDFLEMCGRFDLGDLNLEHKNLNPLMHDNWRDLYTPEARGLVKECWDGDLELFGYTWQNS